MKKIILGLFSVLIFSACSLFFAGNYIMADTTEDSITLSIEELTEQNLIDISDYYDDSDYDEYDVGLYETSDLSSFYIVSDGGNTITQIDNSDYDLESLYLITGSDSDSIVIAENCDYDYALLNCDGTYYAGLEGYYEDYGFAYTTDSSNYLDSVYVYNGTKTVFYSSDGDKLLSVKGEPCFSWIVNGDYYYIYGEIGSTDISGIYDKDFNLISDSSLNGVGTDGYSISYGDYTICYDYSGNELFTLQGSFDEVDFYLTDGYYEIYSYNFDTDESVYDGFYDTELNYVGEQIYSDESDDYLLWNVETGIVTDSSGNELFTLSGSFEYLDITSCGDNYYIEAYNFDEDGYDADDSDDADWDSYVSYVYKGLYNSNLEFIADYCDTETGYYAISDETSTVFYDSDGNELFTISGNYDWDYIDSIGKCGDIYILDAYGTDNDSDEDIEFYGAYDSDLNFLGYFSYSDTGITVIYDDSAVYYDFDGNELLTIPGSFSEDSDVIIEEFGDNYYIYLFDYDEWVCEYSGIYNSDLECLLDIDDDTEYGFILDGYLYVYSFEYDTEKTYSENLQEVQEEAEETINIDGTDFTYKCELNDDGTYSKTLYDENGSVVSSDINRIYSNGVGDIEDSDTGYLELIKYSTDSSDETTSINLVKLPSVTSDDSDYSNDDSSDDSVNNSDSTDSSSDSEEITITNDSDASVTGVIPSDSIFTYEQLDTDSEEYINIAEILAGDDYDDLGTFVVYDLELTSDGSTVDVTDDGVVVTMPVPDALADADEIAVFVLEEDGTLTQLDATVDDGMITFTAPHFSTYVFAEVLDSSDLTTTSVGTGDNSNEILFGGMLIVSLSIIGTFIIKKRNLEI